MPLLKSNCATTCVTLLQRHSQIVDDVYEDEDDKRVDNNNAEEQGDDGDNDEKKKKEKPKPLRTPLSSDWIVPLIKEVITVKPNTSNVQQ